MPEGEFPDPREEDIVYGDRRISRPDASLPDWEVPDTAYRPVPIVWFTGAMFAAIFVLGAIAIALSSYHGILTMVVAGMAVAAIAKWTWSRGMQDADAAWKVATIGMLAVQFGFLAIAVSPRF